MELQTYPAEQTAMARTRRNYLEGPGRDGKVGLKTIVARDNRATGLRDHRQDRRAARVALKDDEDETVTSGKMRRYSNRYGDYEL